MSNERVLVIKNQDGYFVNITEIKKGHHRKTFYTGIPKDGKGCFKYYTNEQTTRNILEMLGEGFYCECVDLNDISEGYRVHIN